MRGLIKKDPNQKELFDGQEDAEPDATADEPKKSDDWGWGKESVLVLDQHGLTTKQSGKVEAALMAQEAFEAYKQGVACDVCGRTRMCWHEWNELLDAATEAFNLLCEGGSLMDTHSNALKAQHILWRPIAAEIARKARYARAER